MQRTILIVDDIDINREILKKILGSAYVFLEAADGREALSVVSGNHKFISAILLDLSMPVMGGLDVLKQLKDNEELSQIPVIVMTGNTETESEEEALRLGASDYIAKPYNAVIVRHRIRNTINLRETSATVNSLQRDRLTGLFNREAFFERVQYTVKQQDSGYYTLSCLNIDNFKIINDRYGAETGDIILKNVASYINDFTTEACGLCCRITADCFAILYPSSFRDSDTARKYHFEVINSSAVSGPVNIRIGRYTIDDTSMSPSAMYDRASLAERSIKGRYDVYIARYEESMRADILREQEIVNEMNGALDGRQFEVWMQPQYNHSSGNLIGAEALVRWRHPVKGLIPPAQFIPVFENNGFVYKLDKFVWEEVCKYQKKNIDAGKKTLPVSVNVSRYDILREDLVPTVAGLTEKYGIPADLLHLEVTESAFAKSNDRIVEVVKELIAYGFTIEIDDFGSGYSSLNTLKSVPAQVVKLDMRFLEDDGTGTNRGGNILESVVRMTKWLGMSVIAEGVEKREQADFLKSIGCTYVQGYYYAKPMPLCEYEALCDRSQFDYTSIEVTSYRNFESNSFWDPRSIETLIFNSYVGNACIYEYCNGTSEILRMTDQYVKMIKKEGISGETAAKIDWMSYLSTESRVRLEKLIKVSADKKDEFTEECLFKGLPGSKRDIYFRCIMRVIASTEDRYLVYCISQNITDQRLAEHKSEEFSLMIMSMMDDMPGGFIRMRADADGKVTPVYFNKGMRELVGMDSDELFSECKQDIVSRVHPQDREIVSGALKHLLDTGETLGSKFRIMCGNGSYMQVNASGRVTKTATGETYINIHIEDAISKYNAKKEQQNLLDRYKLLAESIPGGIASFEVSPDEIQTLYINDGFCLFSGYDKEEYFELMKADPFSFIADEDKNSAVSAVRELCKTGKNAVVFGEYRGRTRDGKVRWFYLRGAVSDVQGDAVTVNVVKYDITEQKNAEEQLRKKEAEYVAALRECGSVVCNFNVEKRSITMTAEAAYLMSMSEYTDNVPYGQIKSGEISEATSGEYAEFFEKIIKGDKNGRAVFEYRNNGVSLWVDACFKTEFSESGKPLSAVVSLFNITGRRNKEEVVDRWCRSVINSPVESFTLLRCNLCSNTASVYIEGSLIKPEFEFNNLASFNAINELYANKYVFEEDRNAYLTLLNSDRLLADFYRGTNSYSLDYREVTQPGNVRWLIVTVELIEDPDCGDIMAYIMYNDIDGRKKKEIKIKELAEKDLLTGTYNRNTFADKINSLIEQGIAGAFVMFDIDEFKFINDNFGHATGDNAIIGVTERIKAILHENDFIGRLGGDEFAVWISGENSAEEISARATGICEAVRCMQTKDVCITASVGISLFPSDGNDFDSLYCKADKALYSVKSHGKNNFALYSDACAK